MYCSSDNFSFFEFFVQNSETDHILAGLIDSLLLQNFWISLIERSIEKKNLSLYVIF